MSGNGSNQGQIRTLDYDNEAWVNISDMKALIEASSERFSVEGLIESAQMMNRLLNTIQVILG